ncbi:NADPH:quinone oxidoreductase family protein [Kyrpidia sp.]|uniref:NADPH:quinone oxidoreductase family protein n=1 Tax=Kyrpidia sp. TaxID=2073077 RepID=UPI00258C0298|nr:NADPH:quinone oxidoreductase family protein [Kyrpidia sp.]MCL6576492.1 NADPH:quinone oxidoreductase family protein [Kyrpidia sp.]
MRAWVVHQLGNPEEVLRLEERPAPVPQAGEVLIDVEAAGVNFLDLLLCAGTYQEKPPLPFTPGAEVTGRIRASGEGVDLPVGNRVIALPALPEGGYAEQIKVPADRVYPVPESMPPAEAAAFFISFHTAQYALHRLARLQRGEVLLVHAGAGGVGSAAIQLGKAAGAGVIATAGGREKVNICRELGADLAIDYREHDFVEAVKMATQGKGANVIFDPVGGDVFDQSRRCIAFEGRILVVGFAGGRIAQAPTNHALVKNYAIWGVHWGLFQRLFPEAVREAHRDLIALYQQGSIRPLVHHRFPFEQLPAALARLASRRTWGKVVLER